MPAIGAETDDRVVIEWIRAHYRVPTDTEAPPLLCCRRCDAEVTWPTRHAAERHGDDVEPFTRNSKPPAEGWRW